jgi:hypothetical protein
MPINNSRTKALASMKNWLMRSSLVLDGKRLMNGKNILMRRWVK